VLPWAKTLAEQKGKVWTVDVSDYIIAGGSLGGYAAAGIVLIHPEIALNAIVQSAALWWPDRQYWLLESWQNILMHLLESRERYSLNMEDTIFVFHRRM